MNQPGKPGRRVYMGLKLNTTWRSCYVQLTIDLVLYFPFSIFCLFLAVGITGYNGRINLWNTISSHLIRL